MTKDQLRLGLGLVTIAAGTTGAALAGLPFTGILAGAVGLSIIQKRGISWVYVLLG